VEERGKDGAVAAVLSAHTVNGDVGFEDGYADG